MCVLSKTRHIIVEEHKAEHQEEGGRVEGKASKEEERTYTKQIVRVSRSCHPVGEANLLKIWQFSRSRRKKIHLLGRGSDAWERGDGDVGRIVAENISDVIRDIVKGDRRSSEWLTLAISVCGTTQEVVGRIAGATLEILLLPTSHLLGAEEGADDCQATYHGEFVSHRD